VQAEYGLPVAQVAFLPLGADGNTAVYRIVTPDDATSYFLKLRRGNFEEISVTIPKFLSDQGIRQVITPLATQAGQLWANLDAFKVMLYPFVAGRDGYEVALSKRHWYDFGAALKRIHTMILPPALISRIPQETYSPQWREIVKSFLERIETDTFADPVAVKLATFLQTKHAKILDLVGRAERLAQMLQAQSPEFVLCHSDVHAANILIDAHDALYIVDWDNPILAPKSVI
jgi:spectinomycin phosphotransferase